VAARVTVRIHRIVAGDDNVIREGRHPLWVPGQLKRQVCRLSDRPVIAFL
jgi:hypothetical protein